MLYWAIAAGAFLLIEIFTVGLVSVWFIFGALAALLAAAVGAPVWLQLLVFLAVSVVFLLLARPLIKKYVNARHVPTNADRVIGAVCRVTETIRNVDEKGAVYVDGKEWSARSEDGSIIEAGTLVKIQRISGVRVIVVPAPDAKEGCA